MPPMRRRPVAGATAALLGALVLTACAGGANPPRTVVERWLAAAAGAEADRGWSLLDEGIRSVSFNGDEVAYARTMAEADWEAVDWHVESARSLGGGLTSVTVAADGQIPELFAGTMLAYPRCEGDTPTGLRFSVADLNGMGLQIGLGLWDGMSRVWTCGEDGEPEFQPSEETVWSGYGLELTNNTELSVRVVSANGRDTDIPPCRTVTSPALAGPLVLSNELGSIGQASGASDEDEITRHVIIGQREIYDQQHPPVYPIAACGGLPAIRQP